MGRGLIGTVGEVVLRTATPEDVSALLELWEVAAENDGRPTGTTVMIERLQCDPGRPSSPSLTVASPAASSRAGTAGGRTRTGSPSTPDVRPAQRPAGPSLA